VQTNLDARCKTRQMPDVRQGIAHAEGKVGRMRDSRQGGCARLGRADARGKAGRLR
jgi:hypothetical protein